MNPIKTALSRVKSLNMRFLTLFVSLFIGIITTLYSQSPIILNNDREGFYIGHRCEILANEPKSVTIDEALSNNSFIANNKEQILLGGTKAKNIWVKFSVDNKTIPNPYLELSFPLIEQATLYTVEEGNVTNIQKSGQNQPFEERNLHSNSFIFNLKKNDVKPIVYYLNIKVKWVCNIKPKIVTYKSLLKEHHYHDLLQGVFLGLLTVLILYNFFLYLKLKDNVYLYYSLYLFCSSFFIIRHEGLTVEFIFASKPYLNDYTLILPCFAGLFGMLFSIKFLNTKTEFPNIHKVLKFAIGLFLIALILVLTGNFEESLLLSHIITPFSSSIIMITAIIMWRRGNSTAKYYLAGWLFLTIGLTIFILENSGIIPPSFITDYSLHAGISAEAIVLSYAIAHRFSIIQKEQSRIQENMINMFMLNQELISQQNRKLEQKVEERTKELQVALEDVNKKEEKLQEYAYRLENSNKELTDFAHIASHDLKAPLRGILSFLQLFEKRNKDKFDDIDREYFDYIKNNARQSTRLIEDLLNYSKIDKNLGEPTDIDINECIKTAEMNIFSVIKERNALIKYHSLPILRGHTSLIVHLFQNLINNGIKYNQSVQPIIDIGYEVNKNDEYVFYVKDNGIGIAPENHEKVFTMFRRLHNQAEYEGNGIGLAFCMRIVETYGGKIWLNSSLGEGSTFHFTLPKAQKEYLELAA